MKLEFRASFHRRQPGRPSLLAPGRVIRGGYLQVITKHLDTWGYRQRRPADVSDICLSSRNQFRRAGEQFRPRLIGLVYEDSEDQRDHERGGEAVDQRLARNRFCGRPSALTRLFRLRADFSDSSDFSLEKRSPLNSFSSNTVFPQVGHSIFFFIDSYPPKILLRRILFPDVRPSKIPLRKFPFRNVWPSKVLLRKFPWLIRRIWFLKFPFRMFPFRMIHYRDLWSSVVYFLNLLFPNHFFRGIFSEVFKQDDDMIRNLRIPLVGRRSVSRRLIRDSRRRRRKLRQDRVSASRTRLGGGIGLQRLVGQ